jgi:UDP-glucose 4-epimerase
MKRFSIVGANSSIARNFVYYLRDRDVELYLYDIQPASLDACANYEQINLLNMEDVCKINFDCDALFVFSGLTGAEKSITSYSAFIDVNEKALLNILTAYVEKKSRCRILYPSSRLVYQQSDTPLKEDAPLEGRSIYALNKIAAEGYLKLFNHLYGVEYTIFRIAIPFGKMNPDSMDYGIVSNLYHQGKNNGFITVYGDGSGVRTFTHIQDICNVFYQGALSVDTMNDVFNIGGCSYSLKQLAQIQAKNTGASIRYIPWPEGADKIDVSNGWLNFEKLDTCLPIAYMDILDCEA